MGRFNLLLIIISITINSCNICIFNFFFSSWNGPFYPHYHYHDHNSHYHRLPLFLPLGIWLSGPSCKLSMHRSECSRSVKITFPSGQKNERIPKITSSTTIFASVLVICKRLKTLRLEHQEWRNNHNPPLPLITRRLTYWPEQWETAGYEVCVVWRVPLVPTSLLFIERIQRR